MFVTAIDSISRAFRVPICIMEAAEQEFSRVSPGRRWHKTIAAEFEYQFAPARDNCVMIKRPATFRCQ
jgi:hypothetical protein